MTCDLLFGSFCFPCTLSSCVNQIFSYFPFLQTFQTWVSDETWVRSASRIHTCMRVHTHNHRHTQTYTETDTHTRSYVFCGRPSAVWVTERIMSRIQDCFNCTCVCVRACVCACVWTGGIDWGTLWGSAPAVCITDMMCVHVCVSFVVGLHACLFLHRARYCTLMHVVLVRAYASLSSGVRVCVCVCARNMSV